MLKTTLISSKQDLVKEFYSLRNLQDVANLLEVPKGTLIYYLYRIPSERRYREFFVKKKKVGIRRILEPLPGLKIVQQKLNSILQLIYSPRNGVHGFVKSHSIATNALVHEKQRAILSLDIADFFPSINFGRVRGMFMSPPYRLLPEVATIMAQICCHDRVLPQGAPTSPIISNMICSKLDNEMHRFLRKYDCRYTRYADDLTISTTLKKFPEEIMALANGDLSVPIISSQLRAIVESNGFCINEGKTRMRDYTKRQTVTGLVVNFKTNVPRQYIRQIRAMLYSWGKFGEMGAQEYFYNKCDLRSRNPNKITQAPFSNVVKGKINFLTMVRGSDDPVCRKILLKYSTLKSFFTPHRPGIWPSHLKRFEDAIWIVENQETGQQGTAFFLDGIGLISCAHVIGNGNCLAYKPTGGAKKYEVKKIIGLNEYDLALSKIIDIHPELIHSLDSNKSTKNFQGMKILVAGFLRWAPGKSMVMARGAVISEEGRSLVCNRPRLLVSCTLGSGMSGGPVVDENYKVIGIIAAAVSDPEDDKKIVSNEVIPLNELAEMLEFLK